MPATRPVPVAGAGSVARIVTAPVLVTRATWPAPLKVTTASPFGSSVTPRSALTAPQPVRAYVSWIARVAASAYSRSRRRPT